MFFYIYSLQNFHKPNLFYSSCILNYIVFWKYKLPEDRQPLTLTRTTRYRLLSSDMSSHGRSVKKSQISIGPKILQTSSWMKLVRLIALSFNSDECVPINSTVVSIKVINLEKYSNDNIEKILKEVLRKMSLISYPNIPLFLRS